MSDQEPQEAGATPQLSAHEVEKREEEKLRKKYNVSILPTTTGPSGHSAFLQKRLAKGQKFFDSGDYQMAKQKKGGINKPPLKAAEPNVAFATGGAIPTPETVPARKTSIIQPSKFTPNPSMLANPPL